MNKTIGIALMLIAITLIAVPTFTDCHSRGQMIQVSGGGTTPMKCHWSGIAEIGVAAPLYVVGAVMTTNRHRKTLFILSVISMMLGGLAVAFPTKLIGVCESPIMICNTLMQPIMVCLGCLASGASGIGLILSHPFKGLSRRDLLSRIVIGVKEVVWKEV